MQSLGDDVVDGLLAWAPAEGSFRLGCSTDREACMLLLEAYEVLHVATVILERAARRVALQFPDSMLPDSFFVCSVVEQLIETRVSDRLDDNNAPLIFILGDTSYGECCVDEVGAQHLEADLVVHYGNACLSPTRSLPVLYIFPVLPGADGAPPLTESSTLTATALIGTLKDLLEKNPDVHRISVLYDVELWRELLSPDGSLHDLLSVREVYGLPVDFALPRADLARVVEPSGEHPTDIARPATGVQDTVTVGSACNSVSSPSPCDCTIPETRASERIGETDAFTPRCAPGCMPPERGTDIGPLRLAAGTDSGGGDERSMAYPFSDGVLCVWLNACSGDGGGAAGSELSPALRNAAMRVCSTNGGMSIVHAVDTRMVCGAVRSVAVDVRRALGRRWSAVERARGAERVGIVAGTLGVSGSAAAVAACKRAVEGAGRRWYAMLVGRPTAAKLGNFGEMDAFVVVSCPQSALLDAREFAQPVLTPLELALAMGEVGAGWGGAPYSADFAEVLADGRLATGAELQEEHGVRKEEEMLAVAARGEWAVSVAAVDGAAEFLKKREWSGLDARHDSEGADVEDLSTEVQMGRSGTARGYAGEGE